MTVKESPAESDATSSPQEGGGKSGNVEKDDDKKSVAIVKPPSKTESNVAWSTEYLLNLFFYV